MAPILAHLIGAKAPAAMAVFHHLRRSVSQREAVMEAAQMVLGAAELELLTALLNVHKSIEAERNALAHGYFGATDDLPDDILWLSTNDYVALKGAISIRGRRAVIASSRLERRDEEVFRLSGYRSPSYPRGDIGWLRARNGSIFWFSFGQRNPEQTRQYTSNYVVNRVSPKSCRYSVKKIIPQLRLNSRRQGSL